MSGRLADNKDLRETFPSQRPRQVLSRRGNQSEIDMDGIVAAQAFHCAFLDNAQKFRLKRRTQLRDFVEEDRPVVCLFESADAPGDGVGERSLFVSEKLGLE